MKGVMKQVEALTKEREEVFARVNEIMKKMEKVDEKISKKLAKAVLTTFFWIQEAAAPVHPLTGRFCWEALTAHIS